MFLASSFADVETLFDKFVGGSVTGKTVTFIPTASLTETVNFYVAAGREALEKRGLIVDELDVSTAGKEEIESKLQKNDYIYVTGGNTFFLLQELKRSGADSLIVEQISMGKTYIGESAGSIVLSGNIEYVKAMDDYTVAPKIVTFSSLGVVDFYPVPHYTNFPFKESVESIISEYEGELNLCPISNSQAIVVNGSGFEVWGMES
ncbi:Type 1 glutamine amidotransferase-like domain-containing protein [Microbulbifer taiwanensis]|uniref:Type 1 glutamine amidotransferase-like domain-containing protein n=1 Tax=Microbulbifer taiwanensis TaxID=986746 RepID=A0ABW1YLT5_9GAMM|nr:Type 1 glutamine amidotransferase-like domain-containing protein [Microbulbifer taiwanensis]